MRMRAAYFDTIDDALARHAMAWRVRREGRCWVQTLKAGQGIVREEHDVAVPGPSGVWPSPDPSRHRGSPVGLRLDAALAGSTHAASERFRTEFLRLSTRYRARRGWVELSLDRGQIVAGSDRLPICELEIELLSGSPLAICELARRLIRRHDLWLDLRSKAQRGHRLAHASTVAQPRRARSVPMPTERSDDAAWTIFLDDCAAQILWNTSQMASDEGFSPEHARQLGIGLRRLQAAIQRCEEMGATSLCGASTATCVGLADSAAAIAGALAASRDRSGILPMRALRSGAVQECLISLIEAQHWARAPGRARWPASSGSGFGKPERPKLPRSAG